MSRLRFPSEDDALLSRHKSSRSRSMAARNSRFHYRNKAWIYSVFVVGIIGLILLLTTSHRRHVSDQKYYIIRPGSIFLDTDGNPINAHGWQIVLQYVASLNNNSNSPSSRLSLLSSALYRCSYYKKFPQDETR